MKRIVEIIAVLLLVGMMGFSCRPDNGPKGGDDIPENPDTPKDTTEVKQECF